MSWLHFRLGTQKLLWLSPRALLFTRHKGRIKTVSQANPLQVARKKIDPEILFNYRHVK